MGGRFCSQCGTDIAEGKKFCRGCGKPVAAAPKPAATVERAPSTRMPDSPATPAAASADVAASCSRCGHAIPAGKRFCGKCGAPVASAAEVSPAPAFAQSSPAAALLETIAPANTAAAPAPRAFWKTEEAASPQAGSAAEVASGSNDALPAIEAAQAPAFAAPPPATPPPDPPLFLPVSADTRPAWTQTLSARKLGLIGAAAALLLAVAGTGFWLHHRHAHAAKAPAAEAMSNSPGAANPAPSAPEIPAPAKDAPAPSATRIAKPSAGQVQHPMSAAQATQVAAPAGGTPAASAAIMPPAGSPAAASASPQAVPAAAPAPPAAPRYGTLHYTGPPVPYGGTVVFRNLSSKRLRFIFDHTAWLPLISRQPDGTQTLTLRSIRRENQAQCDVQWEEVD